MPHVVFKIDDFIINNRVGAEGEGACLCTTTATTFVDLDPESKSIAFL